MKKLSVNLIEFYQRFFSFDRGVLFLFAPGGACRFSPSCSEYTKQMIFKNGVLKGSWLGLKRLWRCR